MTSQPGVQTIALHILLNMSSKDNQAMKFGQLIEYNMRNIFEKNTKCGGEIIPSWPYRRINRPKFVFIACLVYAKLRAIKVYWK